MNESRHPAEPAPWLWNGEDGKRRIKFCTKCGAKHDRESWEALPPPPKGMYADLDGEVLEFRNCACQTTLSIVVRVPES
jgi:hypothetical protein